MKTRKRKPHIAIILTVSLVVITFSVSAQAAPPTAYEGFGAVTRGALDAPGGYDTVHVTNLNDSGAGSFRDAVAGFYNKNNRLVVFDVGGTITLTNNLYFQSSYVTIDGSTAPYPGITIDQAVGETSVFPYKSAEEEGDPVHDIIINNIRFMKSGSSYGDLMSIYASHGPAYNIILDHLTLIHTGDGAFDTTGDVNNVTESWSLIIDNQRAQYFGGLEDQSKALINLSVHHNVYARNGERQPYVRFQCDHVDFVNNVVYGWGWFGDISDPAGLEFEIPVLEEWPKMNVMNNYYHYVSGLSSRGEDHAIYYAGAGHDPDWGRVYYEGNIFPPGENDNVSRSVWHEIPEAAQVTMYDASTLGDTVVPYVGTHYPTQEEQDLLNEISIAISGQGYVLSLSSMSGGSVTNPGEGSFPYDDETDVSIEATADEYYYFVNWTGTAVDAGKVANASAASTTVTVDAYYTIQANFATDLHTLTISSTSGGSVTNPGEGPFLYDDGTGVSIQATADDNYHFVNWTGTAVNAGQVADQGSASTTVTMNADYTLQANFSIDQHNLTISSTLLGGAVTTPGEGTYPYDHGTAASVIAAPTANYHFVNWTGTAVNAGKVANPNAASTTVTVDADYTISANFAVDQHTLAISSTSGGTVTTPGEGTYPYDHGTTASVIATPAASYYFVNWTGTAVDAGKVANPNATSTTVTADADYTIQANFGASDGIAPMVTNRSPDANDVQVPLNSLISLHVTDAGIGVNASSVVIRLDGTTIYMGDTPNYSSTTGICHRTGTIADYTYAYQSNEVFNYDQTVTITVNASDLAGIAMIEQYSFVTEMYSFGQNKLVNSGLDNNDRPVTVCDSSGNIWAAWHAGLIDNRDIYINKLAAGEENFGSTVQLTNNANDQCNPAVALDSNDKLYVVWQDNRQGDWDIYVSTFDGTSWSPETIVNDPGDNQVNPAPDQVNPAIVIDSQNYAHVVWQDDRAGNQDIYVATSSDGFATKTVSQITSDSSDQIEPAIAAAADLNNTIYVVWTDGRNGSNDIYGAASNNPWTNVAIVSNTNNQSSPAIATESTGSILHLLWVDDRTVDGDDDIFYDKTIGGLSPLIGSSIIDDTSGADQLDPTIAVTGSTDNNLKVFACWQDWRDADTDLYFADANSVVYPNPNSDPGINVFVGDDSTNTNQGEPAIGINEYGHPYFIWADSRNTSIYYAGCTYLDPVPLASELVLASNDATVGTYPVESIDDVSIKVPAGACSYDVTITVTKIANLPAFAAPCLGGYDFGPSGIQFSQPVTITIPYAFSGSEGLVTPWFSTLSGMLSQQGITDIQDIPISSSLHALSFKTTHFTAFFLFAGGGAAAIISGGGGGGGCSVSSSGEDNIAEYILPYIGLAVVMAILKMRDARDRKARNMTVGKC